MAYQAKSAGNIVSGGQTYVFGVNQSIKPHICHILLVCMVNQSQMAAIWCLNSRCSSNYLPNPPLVIHFASTHKDILKSSPPTINVMWVTVTKKPFGPSKFHAFYTTIHPTIEKYSTIVV